jgi:hypothetical protein
MGEGEKGREEECPSALHHLQQSLRGEGENGRRGERERLRIETKVWEK